MDHREILGKLTPEGKASLLSGRDFWSTRPLEEYGIPSVVFSDGPHGVRRQAEKSDHIGLNESLPATCFPPACALANSWDVSLAEEQGRLLGEEAAAQGAGVLLGPALNIKRNPLCGRNFEYFSEDPLLSGKLAAAYVRGIQSAGVGACVKHFAANNAETRRMVSDSVIDDRTLREIYLAGFEIAVKEGAPCAVMAAYNKVNGTFASENERLLRDILRGEWGFGGVVMTDWGGGNDRPAAVAAGCDLEMPHCAYADEDVAAAVRAGKLSEEDVDACLLRLFSLAEKYGGREGGGTYDSASHAAFARRCAAESVVLLKNEGVLPLAEGEKVCLIGRLARFPHTQGAGSSAVNAVADGCLSVIGGYGVEFVGYAPGYGRRRAGRRSMKRAVALAERSDTVLFFLGPDDLGESEGIDRENMKLPQFQLDVLSEIVQTGKKVVAVLQCGGAVELGCAERCGAIVLPSLGGQEASRALLDVLTGAVNPSGKLAESFPAAYADCPSASRFPGRPMTTEYREGIYVGYRYYLTAKVPVRYPFGFGMSYTSFSYSDLEVNGEGASFVLTNTGGRAGAETAQLYIGKKDAAVFRPSLELKGFCKVRLGAGESRRVHIGFGEKAFLYFNAATGAWECEGGAYEVCVGASCEDIRLRASVQAAGTGAPPPYAGMCLPGYEKGRVSDVPKREFAALLGREVPPSGYAFDKKGRIQTGENSTVNDLRYARGFAGRAFYRVVRGIYFMLRAVGARKAAHTVRMGAFDLPVRGLAKFGGLSRPRTEGLLLLFNGKFFAGLRRFFSGGKRKGKAKNK